MEDMNKTPTEAVESLQPHLMTDKDYQQQIAEMQNTIDAKEQERNFLASDVIDLRELVNSLKKERDLAVRVAYEAMDAIIKDRCALKHDPDDWTIDGIRIGEVRKVLAWYEEMEDGK